jgi:putative molybdopterin biosynthesis protein
MKKPAPRLTVAEVRERLNLTRQSIYSLIADGALPAYRIGASYRISVDDLNRYLDEARTNNKAS